MFEKILVCLDGSKAAEEVLVHVTGEALCFKSSLTLLRVIGLPTTLSPIAIPGESVVPMRIPGAAARLQSEDSKANLYLEGVAAPLRAKGLDVAVQVLPGIPGETIVHYTEDNGFKLIAIGTHGHSGLRRFAVGSTADYVLHHSSVPVLTVRPKV